MVEITGIDSNRLFVQTVKLSPYITKLKTSELDESVRSKVMPEEIAVTLNGINILRGP